MENALEVKDLKKYYNHNKVKAVDGISFSVQKGERFGFLGPNGAGKTTTIRSILGMLQVNEGIISIFGETINPNRNISYRNQIGYLPGELGLYKEKTARQLIKYLGSLYNGEIDWHYIESLASRLKLDMDRPVGTLSKGNKQKVGVLIALMQDFPLLILDEPTSGLDPIMQGEFYQIIKERQEKSNCTVFISSHLLPEVEKFCDRVAIIRQGKIVEISTIQELRNKNLKKFEVELANYQAVKEFTQFIEENYSDVVINRNIGLQVIMQVHPKDKLQLTHDITSRQFANASILDLNISHSSLEHIFMQYYTQESPITSNHLQTNDQSKIQEGIL